MNKRKGGTTMIWERFKNIQQNEISELMTMRLDGFKQKILIEGRFRSNPILIFLHGGPGSPAPFSAGCRGMFPELTEKFLMVYWDQLGCGVNDRQISEDFTINHFVQMTEDLIKQLKQMFPKNDLYLFGYSWGTILSTLVTKRVPHLINGVMALGQIVRDLGFNEFVYYALEHAKMPKFRQKILAKIKHKKKHSVYDLRRIEYWIKRYTNGYQPKGAEKYPLFSIIAIMLSSPDYRLKDLIAVLLNGTRKNQSLDKEMMQVDLTSDLQNIEVPYIMIQGQDDLLTPTQMAKETFEQTFNPNLQFALVPNCGHLPGKTALKETIMIGYQYFMYIAKKKQRH